MINNTFENNRPACYRFSAKIILSFCFLLFQFVVHAQSLVANGGFEDENICTEYHINCSPEAWLPTSTVKYFYWNDSALAHSGGHLMAILAGHSKSYYKRIYIRSRLVCSLRKGNQYRLSFFVKSRHNILDSIGMYFTSYDFLFEKHGYCNVVPTAFATDAATKPARADTNWQQVVFNYTATGEENFLTLGYFAKNDLNGNTGIRKENNFLFLLDDITLDPIDPNEKICKDWKANTDTIYAQNERHEYLDLTIRLFRYDQPKITRFSATVVPVIEPPKIIRVVDTLVIPDVLFAPGSAVLKNESHALLDSFCNAISKKSFDSLLVEGHTDSIGTLEHNQKLSSDRANAVTNYIKKQVLITDDKLRVYYFAFLKPIASNATAAGRKKNRRVEIYLYRHQ